MRNAFIVFFLSLFICASASAADFFTVDGINVSSSGDSAKQAKETAVLAGQREAFVKLIERVASNPTANYMDNMDSDAIANTIQGVEVHDEKITANYYSATLDISFNRSFIEKFLQDRNINFTDVKSAPIVIIPLLVGEVGGVQFESNNPWRERLAEAANSSHVLNVTILRSLRSVDKEQLGQNIDDILPYTLESLLNIGRSYDAQKLIIAIAAKDGADPEKLNVRLRDIMDRDGTIQEMSFKPDISFHEESEKPSEDVFKMASRSVVSFLEGQWVKRRIESDTPIAKVSVTVPIYNLEQWATLRKKLENLDFLKDVKVKAITLKYALVDISFKDSFASLIAKMQENGFYFENTGESIILHTTR